MMPVSTPQRDANHTTISRARRFRDTCGDGRVFCFRVWFKNDTHRPIALFLQRRFVSRFLPRLVKMNMINKRIIFAALL